MDSCAKPAKAAQRNGTPVHGPRATTSAPAARAKHALENVLVAFPMRPHTGAYCSVHTVGRRGSGVDCATSVLITLFASEAGSADGAGAEATIVANAAANAVIMVISRMGVLGR